jgi:hypothetical protein
MMGVVISRQAAIDALERRLAEPSYQHNGEDWYVGMNSAEFEIEALPSADRPTGEWIGDRCSICGTERAWYGLQPNFCPDCGAKMDGEESEVE